MIPLLKSNPIPSTWSWSKAQEYIDVRDGTHDSPRYLNEGYPLVTSKNLIKGKIDFSTCSFISKADHDAISSRSEVDNGDILYAMIGTIGSPVIVEKLHEFSIKNVALFKFRDERVFNRYVYYFLGSDLTKRQFERSSRGGTQKFVSLTNIRELLIPLPPLKEQQKIAEILDAADALRQRDQHLIDHYKARSQSLFLDMFGGQKDDLVTLSEVCEINPKKSELSKIDRCSKVSFVPMNKVTEEGKVDLTEFRTLGEVWSGFTYFAENDVVMAKITPCMENGKGGIMRGLTNGIGFGTTEFHVIRPLKDITTSEWIYHLISQKQFRKSAEKNMTGSAGQKRVPKEFLAKYKVELPSLEKQNQFADRIALIEKQKQQAEASLAQSNNLFNSLLQKAFTGELTQQSERAA